MVLPVGNLNAIPDGSVLFECDLTIAPDAAPGRYVLSASNIETSDPSGVEVPCGVVAGSVEVGGTPMVGDCNDDGRVTVDELLRGVNIVLATAPIGTCPAMECATAEVGIACLQRAVVNALSTAP